jgi:hypothetical protein
VPPRLTEFAADELEREAQSLHAALFGDRPVRSLEVLAEWVRERPAREALFAGRLWGEIRWERSLGRPAAADFAEGFAVRHRRHVFNFAIGRNGPVTILDKWEAIDPPPLLFTLPDDGDERRVGYVTWDLAPAFEFEITPEFVGPWMRLWTTLNDHRIRRFEPERMRPGAPLSADFPIVLPPFRVVLREP